MSAAQPSNVSTHNPATGAVLSTYPVDDETRIEALTRSAEAGYRAWRAEPIERRAAVMDRVATTLRERVEPLARLITSEMGKTIGEARAEVRKCADLAAWCAERGPAFLADERAAVEGEDVYVSYLPIGTVLGIMPWNFPLWQALRAALPITLGGNAFLLKPAPNVLGCGYALLDVLEASGMPPGVFDVANIGNEAVAALLHDVRIAAVTLTGSVGAGAAVASIAGKVIKKSLLELGGSDPYIVLADADLEQAVAVAVKARFQNCGQVCLAAKRFILEEPIAEAFTARFAEAATKLVVGDPLDETTAIGPIARADLREGLHRQVRATADQGAKLLTGGHMKEGPGFFYEPTVFAAVKPGMTAFDEETFGPVAAVTVARDVEEAIGLANNSAFGLSGNLWTRDVARARAIARRLETGGVFINGFTASNPRTPVGGVKLSGYGRELSHFGVREFTNAQTVWVKT